MKRVLVLGACGNIGPFLTPGLAEHFRLTLADVVPHPDGTAVDHVDVRDRAAVSDACAGHDAVLNLCVVRDDLTDSFAVNARGVDNISRALLEHGIRRVVHTGPQLVQSWYDHDFGVDDVPLVPGARLYTLSKFLGMEISRAYAREHRLDTIWFLFGGLGPKPEPSEEPTDHPPMFVVWEDLVAACRLALELEEVPEHYQAFHLTSYEGHGKYRVDSARRILGFEIGERLEQRIRRPPIP